MTQEERHLLLKDICARLPYGVKVHLDTDDKSFDTDLVGLPNNNTVNIHDKENYETIEECFVWNIKPYLHPMSSMTEEEREEFRMIGGVTSYSPQHNTWAICAFSPEAYDWLLANHFDHRGLIEKGLALEAPEGMYLA